MGINKFSWTGRDLVPEPITSKHIRLKLYKHSNMKLGVSNEFAHLILTTKKWVCSPRSRNFGAFGLTSRKSEQFHQKALSWVGSRYQDSRTHISSTHLSQWSVDRCFRTSVTFQLHFCCKKNVQFWPPYFVQSHSPETFVGPKLRSKAIFSALNFLRNVKESISKLYINIYKWKYKLAHHR